MKTKEQQLCAFRELVLATHAMHRSMQEMERALGYGLGIDLNSVSSAADLQVMMCSMLTHDPRDVDGRHLEKFVRDTGGEGAAVTGAPDLSAASLTTLWRKAQEQATETMPAQFQFARLLLQPGSKKTASTVKGEIHNDAAVQAFKHAFQQSAADNEAYDVSVQAGLDAAARWHKPTLYVDMDTDTGHIYVSAYRNEDPLWENNHIIIGELGRGTISKHESSLNILRNVLAQAGVQVTEDEING